MVEKVLPSESSVRRGRPAKGTTADRAGARSLAAWLLMVAVLVFAMVVVGGITRLTESGLSITEWKPVSGAIPPLNDAQWVAEFGKYQATPEYREINRGMSLDDFKFIYFWEYIHRLLGRVIGVAFALPLLWFWARRMIPAGYHGRLLVLVALGGLQGVIGWWMVVSGLSLRTDVSHFRLAVHLLTALLILGLLLWTARDMQVLATNPAASPARVTAPALLAGAALFVQLLYGAFVAGLNAGLVTNEWPLMNGRFFPADVLSVRSPGDALINDPAMIHFVHRWWAWVAFAALMLFAIKVKRAGGSRESIAIHAALGTQILLGIATVMTGVALWIAVLHQAVGALLVAAFALGAHRLGRR